VREGGVYFVAGGLMGAGLALAEHLARTAAARLVLTAGENFPSRDRWERWLQSHDDNDEISRSIRRVRAIEFAGREVLVRIVDIADEVAMRTLVRDVLDRFGRLDGVVHAEGPPGAGLMQLKTSAMTDAVLIPKIAGALALERVTSDLPLDFFVLFSSVISVAGGVGQVDTCAANAVLDALAQRRSIDGRCFTAAIDWSPFEWDAWNLPSVPGGWSAAEVRSAVNSKPIGATALGIAFDCILSSGETQTVVCPEDLDTVIQRTDSMTASKLAESMTQARPGEDHKRPQLPNVYVAPANPTEEKIAAVWAKSFGLESVGAHDSFFDLAGNSLLAIQIVTQLRGAFQVELPMTALFESPTVAGLARRVDELCGGEGSDSDLETLLDEIERLSSDDAGRLLREERPD
jgi:acyl carrier protein